MQSYLNVNLWKYDPELYLIKVERYNATHIMIHNPNYIELMFTIEHVKQTNQIENLKVQ